MALIRLTHIERGIPLPLPYIILINGQAIGAMQQKEAQLKLPEGNYQLSIKCGMYFNVFKRTIGGSVCATQSITCTEDTILHIQFENRERWWNILFDIDLILWLVSLFITLPTPWGLIYKIASDTAFAIWLLHFYLYRNNYFTFTTNQQS